MRARNIKPGFFKNEELAELSPLTRILFAGLWCMADREGRLEDRPKRIKAEILPYDSLLNCDGYENSGTKNAMCKKTGGEGHEINSMLDALASKQFILRYSVHGEHYIQISNFTKHQSCNVKENVSTIPAPCQDDTSFPPYPLPLTEYPLPYTEKLPIVGKPDGATEKQEVNPSQNGSPPYATIIEYLNRKTGKAYRPQSKNTQRLIKNRWKQGFTLEDFQRVIDTKTKKWLNDPKYCDYLRPETLFSEKFESYLNEKPPKMARGTMTEQGMKNMAVAEAFMERVKNAGH